MTVPLKNIRHTRSLHLKFAFPESVSLIDTATLLTQAEFYYPFFPSQSISSLCAADSILHALEEEKQKAVSAKATLRWFFCRP